jgi:uncharacterized protein YkwD
MILRLITAVTLWAFMNATPAATYSYPAASEEMYAFELLNSERSRCGFGSLRPSAELDSAAKSHAAWLFFNNATGHMQRPGTPGFTGVAPWDRLITADYGPDYSFESTEVQVFHNSTERGSGANAVRSLLNAPYHLVNMLRGYREVGIGVKEKIDLGLGKNNQNIVNIVLAKKTVRDSRSRKRLRCAITPAKALSAWCVHSEMKRQIRFLNAIFSRIPSAPRLRWWARSAAFLPFQASALSMQRPAPPSRSLRP